MPEHPAALYRNSFLAPSCSFTAVLITVPHLSVDHELPEIGGSRAVVLKVRSVEPWESPWPFQGIQKVKTIFIIVLRYYLLGHSCSLTSVTVQFCDM